MGMPEIIGSQLLGYNKSNYRFITTQKPSKVHVFIQLAICCNRQTKLNRKQQNSKRGASSEVPRLRFQVFS
jgi:hypothetical protein